MRIGIRGANHHGSPRYDTMAILKPRYDIIAILRYANYVLAPPEESQY